MFSERIQNMFYSLFSPLNRIFCFNQPKMHSQLCCETGEGRREKLKDIFFFNKKIKELMIGRNIQSNNKDLNCMIIRSRSCPRLMIRFHCL